MQLSDGEFEDLVRSALDELPEQLLQILDNVVVLVEPEPPANDPGLLGLYVGSPLTERDGGYTFQPPDTVLIFQGPLTRLCADREELAEEVTITVVHELAHHVGISEEQLHAWGWG